MEPWQSRSPKRCVLVLAVALLAVLAGCGGGPASPTPVGDESAPPSGQDTGGQSSTPAGDTPTASPTPTPPQAELPGPDALRTSHTETLRSAGSFTARMSVTYQTQNGTANSTQLARVDFDAERAYAESLFVVENETFRATIGGRRYRDGDDVYSQTVLTSSDQPLVLNQTETVSTPMNLSSVMPGNETAALGGEVAWAADQSLQATGTTTFEGVRVTRYAGRVDTGLRGLFEDDNVLAGDVYSVQSSEMSMLVDEDGVVRRMEVEVTTEFGDQVVTMQILLTVTDVGSTTVSPPQFAESGA